MTTGMTIGADMSVHITNMTTTTVECITSMPTMLPFVHLSQSYMFQDLGCLE